MAPLVLLEFLDPSGAHPYRAEWYPFIQGWTRNRGLATAWLAYVAGGDARVHDNPFIVELAPKGRADLLAALAGLAPRTLVTNEKLGPLLAAALGQALPEVRLVLVGDDTPRYREVTVDQVAEWAGLAAPPGDPSGPRGISDHATPDYDSHLLNPEALEAPPFVALEAHVPCVYARPLARNPHYQAIDLSDATRRSGCAFCQGQGVEDVPRGRVAPLDLTLLQVRRFAETAPAGRRPGRFRLNSGPVVHRLGAFLDGVLAMRTLQGSELHLALRADEFLRVASAIEAALPRLAARGHSLHVWNLGVENFSAGENERLNKGLDVADIDAALARLDALEAAWPEAFFFRRHGGLGFILFTPWTTLGDLAWNRREMARVGIPAQGFALTTRAQLLPGAPLTRLAERDGLVVEAFPDLPFLETPCLNFWDSREVPWRFRDPAVAAVRRLLIRARPSPLVPADDPLHLRLLALLDRHPHLDRYELLDHLIEIGGALADPGDDAAWLEALAACLVPLSTSRPADAPHPTVGEPVPEGSAAHKLARWLARALGASRRGLELTRAEGRVEEGTPWVELEWRAEGQRLVLRVLPDRAELPALARAGGFRIEHPAETPVDTDDKRALVADLTRALDKLRARHGWGRG